jgi:hypothetical protein
MNAKIEYLYGVSVAMMTETPYVFPKRSCAASLGPYLYARPPGLTVFALTVPVHFRP